MAASNEKGKRKEIQFTVARDVRKGQSIKVSFDPRVDYEETRGKGLIIDVYGEDDPLKYLNTVLAHREELRSDRDRHRWGEPRTLDAIVLPLDVAEAIKKELTTGRQLADSINKVVVHDSRN